MSLNALSLCGVEKSYNARGGSATRIIKGIDLTVAPGEMVVLLGANGCGKSTILKIAAGITAPTCGETYVGKTATKDLKGEARRRSRMVLGMIYQDARLIGRRDVLANVLCATLGRHQNLSTLVGFLPASEQPFAMECLDQVSLAHLAHRRASTLSGGQAQRVSIARALAQKPTVILADEPVASLDPESAEDVMDLLSRVSRDQNLAVLCVLHQIDLARRYAHRIIGLKSGIVAFDLPAAQVTDDRVAALYGRAGE